MAGIKPPSIGGMKPTQPAPVQGVISPTPTNGSTPMKIGTQSVVKTPKAKKMSDGFGKPSQFFKSEDFSNIKKPSIENLRSFLERQRSKKKS